MSDGNIPEHGAVGAELKADIDQDPEAIKTVQMVMKEFKKLKRHRSKYDKNWLHNYKMFRGDQWHDVKMPKFRQKEIINLIWQTIQSNMPLQTNARPKPIYIPEEPNDKPFAEVLNKVLDADWERNNWLVPLSEIILDGYIYGHGMGSVNYDPEADYGMGSAVFESEDVFYLYPDNEAREVNGRRSEIFAKAEPVDTDRLKKRYPEWAEKIKPDINETIQSSKAALNDYEVRQTNSDLQMADTVFGGGKKGEDEKTLLIKVWMKPDETEEVEQEDLDENNEPVIKVVTKKVYPYGRILTIANGCLLEEEELQTSGNFPFCKYVNYMLPREFFGVSEVEQLESPQRIFNKLINASLEIMNLMGNPVWIVDTSSGINPNKLVNRTGLVVEKEPGSEVRRESGVQMSPVALQMIDRVETWFNGMAGNQEISQGQAPGSVTAASAIEQLMDASRTRIKQKQRNLDAFMRDFARQYADIVLDKYTKTRVFRVTNDDDSTSYFQFRIEDRDDGQGGYKKVGVMKDYVEHEGEMAVSAEAKEFLISGRFDVKINTSTSLPFAVADKEQKAYQLFDRGIIDEQEVLSQIDYPNKEVILERLKERKQAEAEAAAQQQGA